MASGDSLSVPASTLRTRARKILDQEAVLSTGWVHSGHLVLVDLKWKSRRPH